MRRRVQIVMIAVPMIAITVMGIDWINRQPRERVSRASTESSLEGILKSIRPR